MGRAKANPQERRLQDTLSKIRELLDDADLLRLELPPALVATPEPVTVSIQQAAALLGVTEQGLKAYVRSGQLMTLRLGRRRLVRLDTLREFALVKEEAEVIVAGLRRRMRNLDPTPKDDR